MGVVEGIGVWGRDGRIIKGREVESMVVLRWGKCNIIGRCHCGEGGIL